MNKRYACIWFRFLKTDWVTNRRAELKTIPFVLSKPDHGRKIVSAVNQLSNQRGIYQGMVVADARAICPGVEVIDDIPELENKLLQSFALWCIRFTPVTAVDLSDGIILDISGCANLWGGEENYARDIEKRINQLGYYIGIGIADTIGAAWMVSRTHEQYIIPPGEQREIMSRLSPALLRIDPQINERLHKLGLKQIGQLLPMPAHTLRRRFGEHLLLRISQALGNTEEIIQPVVPIAPYQERLPCLEPIVTLTGITIALEQLLANLSTRLQKEGKGIRTARFTGYRIDNHIQHIEVGTHRPSQNAKHLFKLFEQKIQTIEPGMGIELFTLDAIRVEEVNSLQEQLWENNYGIESLQIGELIDRITNKMGNNCVHRYLPDAHWWPERSIKSASSLTEKADMQWASHKPRPIQLLPLPQPIQVAAPVPDYPPMLFRYRGQVNKIKKADGPERIEEEWWIENGEHRDYYRVEDENGARYWIFRMGHYDPAKNNQWFLHGYFA